MITPTSGPAEDFLAVVPMHFTLPIARHLVTIRPKGE